MVNGKQLKQEPRKFFLKTMEYITPNMGHYPKNG